MTKDPPLWKTPRFWLNLLVSILGTLIEAGVIPREWGGLTALVGGTGNVLISAGKRNETIAPMLGYK